MRSFLIAFAGLVLVTTAAQAKVQITVDKNNQMMTVAVDGVQRYQWPVSTGNPSHETPNGTFQTFRMEADHFSKEFDDAPMPHSIFFTKVGHAIHGTESESKLGIPVSHGCVRLSRAHAATLYDLVEKEGVLNTTVTLTGSSQIALARLGRNRTAIARGDIDDSQADTSAGQPVALTPRQAQGQYASGQYSQGRYPQGQYAQGQYAQGQYAQRPDDGYIYPADGSDTGARYPAPRSARRLYDAQAYPQQQPYYYGNPQYAQPPAYQQPQPYYQPRGFFN
ncbi:MAG TPA: L,D-transpeptidase [Bradyrhizobium sp.]|nr:L,D-transpeptidase [Bradyrhizobium sp.]